MEPGSAPTQVRGQLDEAGERSRRQGGQLVRRSDSRGPLDRHAQAETQYLISPNARVLCDQHEKRSVILSLGLQWEPKTSVACVRAGQVPMDQSSVCTCDQPLVHVYNVTRNCDVGGDCDMNEASGAEILCVLLKYFQEISEAKS
jgi:hypothetical protein